MKILVLTSEIRNVAHRGIYAYTKSMLAALKRLGHTTGLLTQAPYVYDARAHLPVIIKDLVYPHGFDWDEARHNWMKSTYRRDSVDIEHKSANIAIDDKWDFLRTVDFFFNAPFLFDAMDFHESLTWRSPGDRRARIIDKIKKRTRELYWDALDIDFVRSAGYEVVITTSPTAIRSKSKKVKVVQTVHDLIPLEYPLSSNNPVAFFRDLRAGAQPADQIIAVSDYTRRSLIDLMPELSDKTSVVYQANPVGSMIEDVSDADFESGEPFGLSSPYFLYVGAVEQRKNIGRMLDAFRMISRQTDFAFVVAGAGDESYIGQIGLRDLSDDAESSITYLGPIADHRKMRLIERAACLVFPSLSEGFGIPLVEAMSLGCPVISSRNTSLAEIRGDAVLYVDDPRDTADLARCMLRVAQNADLAAELKSKGLERAKNFTIDAFAKRLDRWGRVNGIFHQSVTPRRTTTRDGDPPVATGPRTRDVTKSARPTVFDCVLYDGEFDVLMIRLHELASVVDVFVIVEGTLTFSGQPREIAFDAGHPSIAPFADRCRHIIVDDFPITTDAWDRERWQRNAAIRGIPDASMDDIVILADVDEIPRAEVIARIIQDRTCRHFGLVLSFFYFFVDWWNKAGPEAASVWAIVTRRGELDATPPDELRRTIRQGCVATCRIEDAGWHFSYLMDLPRLKSKIKSFSHQEYNHPGFLDAIDIGALIECRGDLFGRADYVWARGDVVRLPVWLQRNRELMRHLFMPMSWRESLIARLRSNKARRDVRASISPPVVICPYVYANELAELYDKFAKYRVRKPTIEFFFWRDEERIGPERAMQRCWEQFPDRDIIIIHTDMAPWPDDPPTLWYETLCRYRDELPQAAMLAANLFYPPSGNGNLHVQHAGGTYGPEPSTICTAR